MDSCQHQTRGPHNKSTLPMGSALGRGSLRITSTSTAKEAVSLPNSSHLPPPPSPPTQHCTGGGGDESVAMDGFAFPGWSNAFWDQQEANKCLMGWQVPRIFYPGLHIGAILGGRISASDLRAKPLREMVTWRGAHFFHDSGFLYLQIQLVHTRRLAVNLRQGFSWITNKFKNVNSYPLVK